MGAVAAVDDVPNKLVPDFGCVPPNSPPVVAIPLAVDVVRFADALPEPNSPAAGADGCVVVPLQDLVS